MLISATFPIEKDYLRSAARICLGKKAILYFLVIKNYFKHNNKLFSALFIAGYVHSLTLELLHYVI